jgi:N-acylneuraminate cytidylyltransferase
MAAPVSTLKTLAIIPARGGSKRLPGKNLRPFLGQPLLQWSIAFARRLPQFDRVIVSTDSPEIADCARAAGAEVPFLRAAELASDTAGSAEVALDALDREAAAGRDYDLVALLQPTSPMRGPERWDEAYRLIGRPGTDAVVGVSPARDHPMHTFTVDADGRLDPWGGVQDLALRTQELPPAVSVNGSLYLIRTKALREERTFFPKRTVGVPCTEPWEPVDIDTEADWVVAEALATHYGRRP